MKSYKQLMATERGGSAFSREENPDTNTKSNLKWLALDTLYRTKLNGIMVLVCVCVMKRPLHLQG